MFSLSPFAPAKLVSRNEFGRPVLPQPARHSPQSGKLLLAGFLPLFTKAFTYIPPTAIGLCYDERDLEFR